MHPNQSTTYQVYLKPTSCYIRRKPKQRIHHQSEVTKRNLAHGRKEKAAGRISKKADRKLRNVIKWLVQSSQVKQVWSKNTKKHHNYKCNFITLTLPTTEHSISDSEFKNKLLRNMLQQLRDMDPTTLYIWKVEAQNNGNIHAHVVTNKYLHWKELRKRWNSILSKNGLIQPYQRKMKAMTEGEYIAQYGKDGNVGVAKLKERYAKGCASNWSDPNTTDVKAIEHIDNLAAYISKYMAKNEEGKRRIQGRLWGCSYELSRADKCKTEVDEAEHALIMYELDRREVKYMKLESEPNELGKCMHYGDYFYWDVKEWGKSVKGELLGMYRKELRKLVSAHYPECQLTIENTPQTGKMKSGQESYGEMGTGVENVKSGNAQLVIAIHTGFS